MSSKTEVLPQWSGSKVCALNCSAKLPQPSPFQDRSSLALISFSKLARPLSPMLVLEGGRQAKGAFLIKEWHG